MLKVGDYVITTTVYDGQRHAQPINAPVRVAEVVLTKGPDQWVRLANDRLIHAAWLQVSA